MWLTTKTRGCGAGEIIPIGYDKIRFPTLLDPTSTISQKLMVRKLINDYCHIIWGANVWTIPNSKQAQQHRVWQLKCHNYVSPFRENQFISKSDDKWLWTYPQICPQTSSRLWNNYRDISHALGSRNNIATPSNCNPYISHFKCFQIVHTVK